MAEPGWYPQSSGSGYWDGQQWTDFRPRPSGIASWMVIVWAVLMALLCVEAILTWNVLICSGYGCSARGVALLYACLAIALGVLAGIVIWALRNPTPSRMTTAILVMVLVPLLAFGLPMIVGTAFSSFYS